MHQHTDAGSNPLPLAVFVLSLIPLVLVVLIALSPDRAEAHNGDLGFKWFSNASGDAGVDDHTTCCNCWSAISSSVSDINTNTVLNPSTVNHSSANIHLYNSSYGNTGWFGGAIVYHQVNTVCADYIVPLSNCNKTNIRADEAHIVLNDYYFNPWSGQGSESSNKQRITTHEILHAYGLNHPNCGDASSVMRPSTCFYPTNPPPSYVVTADDQVHAGQLEP